MSEQSSSRVSCVREHSSPAELSHDEGLKGKNLDAIKKWYSEALMIEIDNWNGTIIKPQIGNETIYSFFTEDDSYFPTEQQEMLNF